MSNENESIIKADPENPIQFYIDLQEALNYAVGSGSIEAETNMDSIRQLIQELEKRPGVQIYLEYQRQIKLSRENNV